MNTKDFFKLVVQYLKKNGHEIHAIKEDKCIVAINAKIGDGDVVVNFTVFEQSGDNLIALKIITVENFDSFPENDIIKFTQEINKLQRYSKFYIIKTGDDTNQVICEYNIQIKNTQDNLSYVEHGLECVVSGWTQFLQLTGKNVTSKDLIDLRDSLLKLQELVKEIEPEKKQADFTRQLKVAEEAVALKKKFLQQQIEPSISIDELIKKAEINQESVKEFLEHLQRKAK